MANPYPLPLLVAGPLKKDRHFFCGFPNALRDAHLLSGEIVHLKAFVYIFRPHRRSLPTYLGKPQKMFFLVARALRGGGGRG